jgi:alkaline phosphatase
MRTKASSTVWLALSFAMLAGLTAEAATRLRIMPPNRSDIAIGQRFDIRVEATSEDATPPSGLRVFVGTTEITARNALDAGVDGERGRGGTGATPAGTPANAVDRAPPNTTNFLLREYSFVRPGDYTITARTSDGAEATVRVRAHAWRGARPRADAPRARNVILLLGDGMGAAHRTAARIVSRGVQDGKAVRPLAMDTLEVTGQVMTFSLNSVITDSSPGMSSYVTGQKSANNQEGVFPDNTPDAFDNPRVEYLGELLRRERGKGFGVGIVTTADATDATPGANAIHTADRGAGAAIAARFFDERDTNGVQVLMGGGSRHFRPKGARDGARADARDLAAAYVTAGYTLVESRTALQALTGGHVVPPRILGLFHTGHLPVAFDKVGQGRYSEELAQPLHEGWRDPPMLDEMAALALKSLAAHSPSGFYLMIEGASIDKKAHAVDAERTIWDTIEFDNAVRVALDFADRTNSDANPANDTLVIVTADHECGGMSIVGVGNERYAPTRFGSAVRDYAAVFRFEPAQRLNFMPNYESDDHGYPRDPDPPRKLLIGWGAAPDHFENWLSNRRALDAAVVQSIEGRGGSRVSVASPLRDGPAAESDNRAVSGVVVPGFLVRGVIENGEHGCADSPACPDDVSSEPHTIAGHTASDVPLSASGPGGLQFTGTYDNTDVFLKILRAMSGSYPATPVRARLKGQGTK